MAPTRGGNKSLTKMMLSSDTIASRSVRAEAEGCCLCACNCLEDWFWTMCHLTDCNQASLFITTPILGLETQWPTLKRRCCLVTVWPLLIMLSSPLHYSSLLNLPLSSFLFGLSFSQSSLLFSLGFLSKFSFTLLHQTQISCIRTLRSRLSDAEITVFVSLSLILPQIFHFHALLRSPFPFVQIALLRLSNGAITTFIAPPSWKFRGGDKELIPAIITIQTLWR